MNPLQQNFLLKCFFDTLMPHQTKPSDQESIFMNPLALSFLSAMNQYSNYVKLNDFYKNAIGKCAEQSFPIENNQLAALQLQMRNISERTKSTVEDVRYPETIKKETLLLKRPPNSAENQTQAPMIKLEEESPTIKIEEENKGIPSLIKVNVPKAEALEYIQNILAYLVKNVGRIRGTKLKIEGEKFHHNIESIKEIYEGLMNKFMISNKTKEEKIKYVLRKSFKFMKEKLMIKNGMNLDAENDSTMKKQIEIMFFDHYFADSQHFDSRDYSYIKDMIMPFRKNSQNKTMNSEFLKKIFSFEKFYSDYMQFLRNFKEIAARDNREKLVKTSKKIADLMPSRQYKEFSQKYFKRMPWLEIWVDEAETIAKRLIETLPKKEIKIDEEETIIKKQCLEILKIENVSNPVNQKKIRSNSI